MYMYIYDCNVRVSAIDLVTLRNVVEFLKFAEAYCADQLKKSCLQFICVNAACFLEGIRYSVYMYM